MATWFRPHARPSSESLKSITSRKEEKKEDSSREQVSWNYPDDYRVIPPTDRNSKREREISLCTPTPSTLTMI